MSNSKSSNDQMQLTGRAIDIALRVFIVGWLLYWCLQIFQPFAVIVVWGVILAVTFRPMFNQLVRALGGRTKTAGAIFAIVGLAVVILPAIMLGESVIETSSDIAAQIDADEFVVPPPSENVKGWPLIGEKLYASWSLASENLDATLAKFGPQLKSLGEKLLALLASFAMTVLQGILSIIVATLFLVTADAGEAISKRVVRRLAGDKGAEFVDVSAATIRSVVKGVLGIAAVQALLSAIGMYLIHVPAAALWTLFVLIFAIIQLPPLLVLGPVVVWVLSSQGVNTWTVIFSIYALIVSGSDAWLKPLLLGRGVSVPMPVILIGAIGGMMLLGIIGLFLGSVIFAMGYKLFQMWMEQADDSPATADTDA